MREKFAAQLTTVRELTKKDFPGTLRDLKKMGWPAVQISRLWGWEANEIAKVLQETGLKVAGMHVSYDRLEEDMQQVLEEARLFKTKDIVLKSMPSDDRSEEIYKKVRKQLNEFARKLAPDGYRISYHNHAYELESTVEGQIALEYMLDPVPGNDIYAEIDVYWVKKGGHDPLQFIKRYANRMPIIHLKDMTNDELQTFAEVGNGSIDFAPILRWGEQNGIEWYAVEQDKCPGNPMDSLQMSLDHLNKLAEQLCI